MMRLFDPHAGSFELWETADIYTSIGVTPERFVAVCEEATESKYTHKELYEVFVYGSVQSVGLMRPIEGKSGMELTWRRGIKAAS